MRDGVVLLVLCVLLVGVVAAALIYTNRVPSMGHRTYEDAQPAVQAKATEPPKPAPKPAKRNAPDAAAVAEPASSVPLPAYEIQPAVRPPRPRAPLPVVAAPARPFPSVADIAVGVLEDAITDEYGDPVLSATTSDRGHMVETLVYAADGRKDVTVISLQDGRVAAAYSKPRATSAVAAPLQLPLRRRGG